MASAKQEIYRKLMKEQKKETKKIDHPLARYNNVGQLSCAICSVLIKSDILWKTHLTSKKHKSMVSVLKSLPTEEAETSVSSSKPKATTTPAKRRQEAEPDVVRSKKWKEKDELPKDFFDANVKATVEYSDSDSESSDSKHAENQSCDGEATTDQQLSTVFVDAPQTKGESSSSQVEVTATGSLPEGFFDDPKVDAKVRHVEFKDPMDEEWEKFQKSIQQEEKLASVIQEEDDNVTKEDRELEEVNELVLCFTRAEKLRIKQEEFLKRKEVIINIEDKDEPLVDETDSDVEYEEFLDWRKKKT